jgi:hypothetical protein
MKEYLNISPFSRSNSVITNIIAQMVFVALREAAAGQE